MYVCMYVCIHTHTFGCIRSEWDHHWGVWTQQLWTVRLSCPIAHRIIVPQPGIEPTSTTLEGRVLTTGPPGKFPEC